MWVTFKAWITVACGLPAGVRCAILPLQKTQVHAQAIKIFDRVIWPYRIVVNYMPRIFVCFFKTKKLRRFLARSQGMSWVVTCRLAPNVFTRGILLSRYTPYKRYNWTNVFTRGILLSCYAGVRNIIEIMK